jgi:methionyl aminopeptidase
MINLKTPDEIKIMAEGGGILGKVLDDVVKKAKAGITTLELDQYADYLINKNNSQASFKTVKTYRWATCICLNDVVVHGIPKATEVLEEGDIVGIDIGLLYQGFHTDIATTITIGDCNEGKKRFLQVGIDTLRNAIKIAKPGNHIGDISQTIETGIKKAGYSIVKQLVGHGVGKTLHEDPQIPGWREPGKAITDTIMLETGMTLAIEIIYAMGEGDIVYKNDDGWTIATKDSSLAGLFEKTIAISFDGPRVLTPYQDKVL